MELDVKDVKGVKEPAQLDIKAYDQVDLTIEGSKGSIIDRAISLKND